MRGSTLMFLLISLFSVQAHAMRDLMSLCERKLTLDSEHILELGPEQIAIRGPLSYFWEPGMEEHMGWIVGDDFIKKNISPLPSHYYRWMLEGDHVFILDENGKVTVSGYFQQRVENENLEIAGEQHFIQPNNPYLFRDKDFMDSVIETKELRKLFMTSHQAVVVQNLPEDILAQLTNELRPWFERYYQNLMRTDRFVRVGRRRAVELAHFHTPRRGTILVEASSSGSKVMDWETAKFGPGPTVYNHRYKVATTDGVINISGNETIMLLDENELVTFEATVGSPELPLTSTEEGAMAALAEKLRTAKAAFVIEARFRDF